MGLEYPPWEITSAVHRNNNGQIMQSVLIWTCSMHFITKKYINYGGLAPQSNKTPAPPHPVCIPFLLTSTLIRDITLIWRLLFKMEDNNNLTIYIRIQSLTKCIGVVQYMHLTYRTFTWNDCALVVSHLICYPIIYKGQTIWYLELGWVKVKYKYKK